MSNSLATPSKRLDTQPVKEDMHKLMNEAVGLVQDQANRVEHDFLEPVYAWYQLNARMYPTTTVFLSVFSLLSLLPVATFIAFSTVVFASCITGAVTVALVAACSVCAIAGTILLFTLALTLGGAVCITSTYVTALLTYRLYFHLFDKEGRGLEAWLRESLARFGLTQSTGPSRLRSRPVNRCRQEPMMIPMRTSLLRMAEPRTSRSRTTAATMDGRLSITIK